MSPNSKVIKSCLSIIKAHTLSRFPQLYQILLVGGYARGEAGVYHTPKYQVPINDIDAYLVFAYQTPPPNQINQLQQQLNQSIRRHLHLPPRQSTPDHSFSFVNDFFVDLYATTKANLSRPLHIIRYWEMSHTAKVLHGPKTKPIPTFNQKKIPLSEGVRFLSNQLTVPIKHRLGLYGIDESFYFHHRTWTSFATALLLLKRQLKPSYTKRAKYLHQHFKSLFPQFSRQLPALSKQIVSATEFKTNPDFKLIHRLSSKQKKAKLDQLHQQTISTGLTVYNYFIDSWLDSRQLSTEYYRGYTNSQTKARLANAILGLLFNHSHISPEIAIFQNTPKVLRLLGKPNPVNLKSQLQHHLDLFQKAKQARQFIQTVNSFLP